MGLIFKIPAGAGALTYATFDPANKGTNTDLSNNNLTMSVNLGAWNSARSTQGKSTGKWVVEMIYDPVYWTGIGLATASGDMNGYLGQGAGTVMYCSTQGYLAAGWGGGVNGSAPVISAGTPVMIAVDADAGYAWLLANGSPVQGDPAAGTGPTWTYTPGTVIYPAASVFGGGARYVTANFGATAFTNTVPTGFNSGWYE